MYHYQCLAALAQMLQHRAIRSVMCIDVRDRERVWMGTPRGNTIRQVARRESPVGEDTPLRVDASNTNRCD